MSMEVKQFGGGRVGLDAYEVYSAVETDAGRTPLSREDWTAQWQDASAQKAAAEAAQSAAESAKTGAEEAQAAAEAARDNAQGSARTVPTWAELMALTGSTEGEGAEVLDSDTGTHGAASGTGYDGTSVDNAGRYSWNETWQRWVRIGDTGLAGKAAQSDLDAETSARQAADSARLEKAQNLGDVDDAASARTNLGLASVAASGDSDDLTEGATHLLMTKPERDLIAQGGAVAPALDDWAQLVIDDAGQPVQGVKSDGSQWTAEGGRMVKKASGGLLSEGAPRISDWLELHTDADGKIVLGTKADGSVWAAQNGELVQITSGGRGDRVAPQIGDWAMLTRDADGRPVAGTKADGSTWRAVDGEMVKVTSGGRALELAPKAGDWVQLTQDASGAPVLGQRETGQIEQALGGVMVPLLAERGLGRLRPQSYAFDHNSGTYYLSAEQAATVDYLIMVVGQSLSEGSNTDASDGPVTTSPDHAGYALMPEGGVGRDRTDRYDAYEDLYEIRQADTGTKETICSGMADAIMRRLNSELGFKPRMIFDVAGRGGVAYYGSQSGSTDTGLKIGSDPFDWALRRIESARDVSARAGRQLVVAGIVVVHGEQDTTEGTSTEEYKRALSNWERTLGDEAMRLTGQAIRPRWYLTQTNRPAAAVGSTVVAKIPRAQAEAPEINPQLCLVGATYFQEDCGDHSHPTAASYRRIGGMVGNAIASDLFGPYHVPLKIVDAWQVDATTIRAQFSMDIALETDDSRVTISTLGAGKGIQFDDRSGSPPTVTGISIVGGSGDTVELTLSGAPSGYHRRLLVANQATGTGPGAVTGPRSGIRSATSYDTDPLDSYDHYWWAVMQVFDF